MNPGSLSRPFLSPSQRAALRDGIGIYVFHKIASAPRGTSDPFEYIAPQRLRAKLSTLKSHGYRCFTLDDLIAAKNLPGNGFILTFDDGYRNTVENALPILHEFNLKAMLYVVAGKIGGENTWDQAKGDVAEQLADETLLREWLAAGHQIGSHSLTHANLRKLSEASAREEIQRSRQLLEDKFGIAVRHFCYPYGAYSQETPGLVEQAGYVTATTVKFGVYQPGESLFELDRLPPLSTAEWGRKLMHRLFRRTSR